MCKFVVSIVSADDLAPDDIVLVINSFLTSTWSDGNISLIIQYMVQSIENFSTHIKLTIKYVCS